MKDAISKNSIVAIRLVDKQLLGDAKVLHYKGEKTTLYDKTVGRYRLMKEYDDTLIKYKGFKYTLNELSTELCCTLEVDNDNNVWISSQIITYYQNKFWDGKVESKHFDTDEEALKEFNKIVEENNMKIINE